MFETGLLTKSILEMRFVYFACYAVVSKEDFGEGLAQRRTRRYKLHRPSCSISASCIARYRRVGYASCVSVVDLTKQVGRDSIVLFSER